MEETASPAKRAVTFFATGLGLGYSPVAPGTVGSLWGVLIVVGLAAWGPGLAAYIAVCAGLTLLAIPVCHVAEQVLRKKDDGRIVADEFLTFPICMIGLPVGWEYAWLLAFAFCTNRFFDIIKLPPARQLDRWAHGGGVGITLDDAAACLYSLAANWAAYLLVTRYLLD